MEQKGANPASLPPDEREQLRLLVDSVRDYAIFLTDTRGRIVRWTPGVRSILGYEEAEFVGQNAAILFMPEDRERGEPEWEMQEAATRGRVENERWHLRKDGSRFFAAGSLAALRDKDGTLRGYSKILRDTTERRRMDEEEKRRLEELRYLTTRAHALLWHGTVRKTGPGPNDYAWEQHVFDDEAAQAFFPLEMLPDERYSDAWYRHRLPEGKALTDRLIHRALGENGGSYQAEFGCKSRDGEIRWFSEEVHVEPLAPGEWRVVGVALDITERKRGEEALQASEERFRLLVEGVRDYAIVMLDPEGNVATWNSAAERNLGYAAAEILGRHFSLFYTPEERERGTPERLLREARERRRVEVEGERVRKDGRRIWVSTAITALRDEAGDLRGYSVISRDITEKKRAEQTLQTLHRQISEVLESISDAFYAVDAEWRFTYVNHNTERIWGMERGQLLGKKLWEVFPRSMGSPLHEAMLRAMGERQAIQIEYRSPVLSAWLEVNLYPSGEGLSVYFRDITERKTMEAERAAQSERNRRIAETLQRSMLLAPERGAFPGLEVAPLYQAALEEAAVGGDFFDAFSAGSNRVALVVGDVSGKGLAAAQRTSQVKYALRAFVQEYPFPARALSRLNRLVYDTLNDENRFAFVTISLAVVDTIAGRATFALGGAEPPLVLRAGGQAPKLIEAGGLPLGIDPEADYAAEVMELERGDTLLLFTDGLTEAHMPRGPLLEHAGVTRLAEQAAQAAPDLAEMGETILGAARAFSGGSFRDDVCLLLARWTPRDG